jgi:hypothetical protein
VAVFLLQHFRFPPLMPGCVVYQLQRKYGDEGWGGTMKKTQDGEKNDELFMDSVF